MTNVSQQSSKASALARPARIPRLVELCACGATRLGFDSDIAKPEPGGVPGLFEDAWTRRWLALGLGLGLGLGLTAKLSAQSLGACTGPLTDVATSELSSGTQRKGFSQQKGRQAERATKTPAQVRCRITAIEPQPWPKT